MISNGGLDCLEAGAGGYDDLEIIINIDLILIYQHFIFFMLNED